MLISFISGDLSFKKAKDAVDMFSELPDNSKEFILDRVHIKDAVFLHHGSIEHVSLHIPKCLSVRYNKFKRLVTQLVSERNKES